MAEAEYISKEAALACFSDWIDRYGHEHSADEIAEYQRIEDLPVEDVRPVVRGDWIVDRAFGNDVMSGGQMVICSICNKGIFYSKQNFCPNCGADMREVDADGES